MDGSLAPVLGFKEGEFIPGAPVEFEIVLPTTSNALRYNVRHALTLGLPEADNRMAHLNIVANGPSARGLKFKGATLAINGAINLPAFVRKAPDMWIACDPQELVADFIKTPSKKTTFLVASKCHPKVFERLAGHDVRLWHLSDVEFTKGRVVPCATSVTLTALLLAQRLGARSIDVWGWDCCFADDGAHHAATGEINLNASVIDVRVGPEDGGVEFKTTPTWCLEAQEAVNILPLLRWAGVDVVIHGAGMVRAIAAEYAATPLPGLKL